MSVEITCQDIWPFVDGKRLVTTSCTQLTESADKLDINWSNHDISPMTTRYCCPSIESVKVNTYLQCANINCKRKVVPFPGETKVRCSKCDRVMRVSRCSRGVNVDFTITHEGKQDVVTAFADGLNNVIQITDQSDDQIEDVMLDLSNIDFCVNRKKVVTSMLKHTD